jgi:hypothetical protein
MPRTSRKRGSPRTALAFNPRTTGLRKGRARRLLRIVATCGQAQFACAIAVTALDMYVVSGGRATNRPSLLSQSSRTRNCIMPKDTFRVVTRGADGKIRIKDYPKADALLKMHTQIGVDDCSTDLGLRGQPVFQGLVGPMPEGKNIIRYESPDVFESMTKEWSMTKVARRRRGQPPTNVTSDAAGPLPPAAE